MTNAKTIKVGTMPGRIEEFAVEVGSTVASVLTLAGLDASGFEVKVDGVRVTDLNSATVTNGTNAILLAKQVKGNAMVKIGSMPGRIEEFALEEGTTIQQAIDLAGLSASGFEVKVDGTRVTDLNTPVGNANAILLAKQVKGNANGFVKIGSMPGRIEEFALDPSTTFAQAIDQAGLSASGFEVKADGTRVTNLDAPIGSTGAILLAKQVKGN